MNRKAQEIGLLLPVVPIMFLLVIIMAIFMLLASAGSIGHAKDVFKTDIISQSSLMERNVSLAEGQITVRDALLDIADNYFTVDGKDKLSALGTGLKALIIADAKEIEASSDMCLMIFAQVEGRSQVETTSFPLMTLNHDDGFFIFYLRRASDGFVVTQENNGVKTAYSDVYAGGMMNFNLLTKDNKQINGKYYYGGCLE